MSVPLLPFAPSPFRPTTRPAVSWVVRYVLNFPTGGAIETVLHYEASTAAAALRSFNYEMNRARLLYTFRCSVLVLSVEPAGVLND